MAKTILFLAANPIHTDHLRLGKEASEIEGELRRAKRRDKFLFQPKFDINPDDLHRAMLELKPSIVHFSGHGVSDHRSGVYGIVVENDIGEATVITTDVLKRFFNLFPNVECVVLNACYTAEQAQAIAQSVKYVIGMTNAVSDEAARKFAARFYSVLGDGQSIEFAYQHGSLAMLMYGVSEELTPVMFSKQEGERNLAGGSLKGFHNFWVTSLEPLQQLLASSAKFVVKSVVPQVRPFASWIASKLLQIYKVQIQSNTQRRLWLQWTSASTISFITASLIELFLNKRGRNSKGRHRQQ